LPSIEFTIRNEQADMSVVRDALDRFTAEHGLSGKPLIELQVVLDEIVSNIIKYAWLEGGAHELRLRLSVDGSIVEVEISDDGRPYDPRNAPPPPRAAPGMKPRPGGIGVHMVKQLVDGFDYKRVDGYNRVTLTKRCIVDG
jgi:anti-sigma regulatory factor (Ser/Thr protein kinase)